MRQKTQVCHLEHAEEQRYVDQEEASKKIKNRKVTGTGKQKTVGDS